MAKKQKTTAHIEFFTSIGGRNIEDVVVQFITPGPGKMRFFHVEQKGNTWLLLDATGVIEELGAEPYTVSWERPLSGKKIFGMFGQHFEVTILTVIRLGEDKPFYHLDELPDGTWRLCYTEGFIPADHELMERIIIEKDYARG